MTSTDTFVDPSVGFGLFGIYGGLFSYKIDEYPIDSPCGHKLHNNINKILIVNNFNFLYFLLIIIPPNFFSLFLHVLTST